MSQRDTTSQRQLAASAAVLGATLLITGCTATPIAVKDTRTPTPTATRVVETLEQPLPVETSTQTPAPTAEATEPAPTATATAAPKLPPRVDALRIGGTDFTGLDWDVTCGGLDSAPSVLGTAERDGEQYVFMLLASGTDQLLSFTFSYGPAGGGHASKTGLTVTPGGSQGNGTFTMDGARIISDGRGIAYSPDEVESSADTLYTAEFTCDNRS